MTTIKDVAQKAGVSFKTVSRVLNNDMAVRDSTRAKVLTAIEELGYRPNIMARSLRSQRTHTIGFLTDSIATTPYAGQILQGAQDLAWKHNILLLTVTTNSDHKMKQTAVNTLLDRQVDGIIYATMYHREVHPPDNVRELPTVLLDCFVADQSLPSVVPDEVTGGREAVEHLIKKGHQQIGFICDEANVPAKIGRLQGYQEALAAHDIPFEPALVRLGGSMQNGGYDCAMDIMQQPDPPTALFCYNDRMAMGAYDALRKLQRRIPEDIAVVGFDNQELIAAHLYPPLTTMELPHYQMGQWAVNHLLRLIEEPEDATSVQQKLPCPLIERLST